MSYSLIFAEAILVQGNVNLDFFICERYDCLHLGCMSVLFACMYVYHVQAWYPLRPQEDIVSTMSVLGTESVSSARKSEY